MISSLPGPPEGMEIAIQRCKEELTATRLRASTMRFLTEKWDTRRADRDRSLSHLHSDYDSLLEQQEILEVRLRNSSEHLRALAQWVSRLESPLRQPKSVGRSIMLATQEWVS